jgi:phage-related minor tail protein
VADAIELATAYVALVPSFAGAQGAITKELVPAAEAAGDEAGAKAGGRFGGALSRGLAAAGAGAALAGIGKGLYDIGATFDDVADTIRVGTGASGEALDGLVDVAANVGKTVPAEYEKIGPVVSDLNTRLGLSGDTLQTVASQYLEAGRILGQDVDVAKTTAAFSAFKIEGDDVAGAMDTLFQVSQATGVGMNELAAAAQQNGAAMQNLGFGFDETVSLVGSLDKAGINSTQTLAAMSKGLVTLAKDGEEPQEAFRRVTGEIEGLIEKGDTAGAIDLASGIFGTRAASQFVGAVQSGTLALDDLVGGVGATGDTILGVGAETQDFAEKWQIVKNNAMAALEPLGSAVFAALGDSLTAIMPSLQAFGEWLAANPAVIQGFAIALGVLAVGLGIAAAAQWAMNSALLASPITWIVVGIMALIAGLVLLIANWDTVVVWLKSVWGSIVGWLSGVWASITAGISSFAASVAQWFTNLWSRAQAIVSAGVSAVVGWFTNLWTRARAIVSTGINAVVGFFTSLPGRAIAAVTSLASRIANFFSSALAGARAAVGRGVDGVIGFFSGLPGRILRALGSTGRLLVSAGMNILDGFLSGLRAGFDRVKGFVGGIGSWIADHKGPKAYDLALLVPAGGWIMQGLQTGLERQIPQLRQTLGRVSSEIETGVRAAPQATAQFDVASTKAGTGASGGMSTDELLAELVDAVRSWEPAGDRGAALLLQRANGYLSRRGGR